MATNQEELIELYKLHAELADRVSQRREGANRLFVTLLTGLMVAVVAVTTTNSTEPDKIFLPIIGSIGIALSISWYIIIRSYRQLNTGKFAALQELEENLAYPFFTREWELLDKGKKQRTYWKLTVVERLLPILFSIVSIVLILWEILF